MSVNVKEIIEVSTFKYEYIKYALALHPIMPSLKKSIDDSNLKFIIIMAEDLFKEMGPYFVNKSDNCYANLRFVMFAYDIIISYATHRTGKKAFILRHRTIKDKTPRYWKDKVRKLRRQMKFDIWEKMVESKDIIR